MKNINIPEPCSEDWNKMTPNEKGAFCQKCALDVYDFTNKSADEIREILTINIGSPVCMRIEPKQLDKLNNDFSNWKMDNKHSYQRAWVFTLLVVFGMTLFSCEEDQKPVVESIQKIGQVILNQEDDKGIIDPTSEVIASEVETTTTLPQAKTVERQEQVVEVENKNQYQYQTIQNTIVVDNWLVYEEVYATAGVPIISESYNTYLLETHFSAVDSLIIVADQKITGLVYPNPASNQTTLQINMPVQGEGEIQLFALNGQMIRTIHSGRIRKGESEFPIDLTNLETGLYLVVVYSGEMKETIKFSKI